MCGRFVSARKRLELLEEFAVERDRVADDRGPDYNVAPTRRIYAVMDRAAKAENENAENENAENAEGGGPRRELRLVRWGLVPSWSKDAAGGARMINARAETVAVKPAFRVASSVSPASMSCGGTARCLPTMRTRGCGRPRSSRPTLLTKSARSTTGRRW
jgi:putative SOS response-associated peptidase YedK